MRFSTGDQIADRFTKPLYGPFPRKFKYNLNLVKIEGAY
jgi:hypothetical protein